MTTAEPDHVRRNVVGAQNPVVADRLLQREQSVRRPLHEQGRHANLPDETISRAPRPEPGAVVGRDSPGREPLGQRVRDVRIESVMRPLLAERIKEAPPPGLRTAILVEAGDEGVPGDHRDDRVDPAIQPSGDELDPAAIAGALHAEPRVARAVPLCLRLVGDVRDQPANVSSLEARAVGLHSPAGIVEPARVPGQHVVAGVEEDLRPRIAEVVQPRVACR